jgi:hypothetical protein
MALPLSGPLSLGNIRTELGIPGVTNFSLTNASVGGVGPYPALNSYSWRKPTFGTPHGIGEWYGYDHSIGYVLIGLISNQFQNCPTGVFTEYTQTIIYYNKSGVNVASPYNISINGSLALGIGAFNGDWNYYYYDDCNNTSFGAPITPTSVVITGTSTKVWVDGTGFL